jgi:hypothetical protein
MPVKKNILRAAGILAFAVLAYFLVKPPAEVGNRVVLDERRPAALKQESTVRNVTKTDLEYTIEPNPYRSLPKVRKLAVGAVDRIATDLPLEISFDNGTRKSSSTIFPGRPYSFRNDENGLVKVYPGSHGRQDAPDLAPFVPTPLPVVDRMLALAEVGRDDVVYDIGCGDGRIVIAAAEKYGARGVGIDIDPKLIKEAGANAKKAKVTRLVRFVCTDATKAHISEATVLALYLLPESLEVLKPMFENELKPGGRIVSHNYRIPGWDERIAVRDELKDEKGRAHKIYLYRK